MIRVRKSGDRGHLNHGWLDTYHTFSFGEYRDPDHMGFRDLRVINEDWIEPGVGFPPHPHRDMEIITYVLEGGVRHEDSMGNQGVIAAGEVQRMTAGTGVTHSERNASDKERLHLLQIWLFPERKGLTPGYEQVRLPEAGENGLRLVASRGGDGGAVHLNQDAQLWAGRLPASEMVEHPIAPGRHLWLQLIEGVLDIDGTRVEAGDGVAVSEESALRATVLEDTHFLLFDLN